MRASFPFHIGFFKELKYYFLFGHETKKAPAGISESLWSLHIRSFWKIHFINPPEVQDQVVGFTEIMKGTMKINL